MATWVTVDEAANMFGVSTHSMYATARAMETTGAEGIVRFGKAIRLDPNAIAAFTRPTPPTSPFAGVDIDDWRLKPEKAVA